MAADDFEQADTEANAALEYARSLPPGTTRSQAFKEAGRLRSAADRLRPQALRPAVAGLNNQGALTHAGLKAAFEKHLGETEGQIDRLEQVFAEIDKKPQSKTCDAIVGIAKEGQEIMDEYKGMPAHDAGLLAAAQAVEHYEMTRYGTLRTWAEELGYAKSAKLLQQTLDEERATDAALTKLAKAVINLDAEKDEAA